MRHREPRAKNDATGREQPGAGRDSKTSCGTSVRSSSNTVDLSPRGRTSAQPGDPLVEAVRLQTMGLAIRLACEAADGPVADVLVPEGANAGLGWWSRGSLRESCWERHRLLHLLHKWCDNPDKRAGADDRRGRRRPSPCLGWEVAHLAFHHTWMVSTATLLGRCADDLDQDHLMHLVLSLRGKTRHKTADAAGQSAPCGGRTTCPGRTRPSDWRHGSAAATPDGREESHRVLVRPDPPGDCAASGAARAGSP